MIVHDDDSHSSKFDITLYKRASVKQNVSDHWYISTLIMELMQEKSFYFQFAENGTFVVCLVWRN